jgi:hypothetical protein
MDVVDDVAAGYGNIRVAVEANEKRESGKGVASVAGVAHKSGRVDGRATTERGACLDVMVERGVVWARVRR